MTTSEFSLLFDILYNNIMSNLAPGLNEYEKSSFLTKALYEITLDYFNPKGNHLMEGFDFSRDKLALFSSLIRETLLSKDSLTPSTNFMSNKALVFIYPEDCFIIINEIIRTLNSGTDTYKSLVVEPLSYIEYDLLMSKPYKMPPKSKAWRLTVGIKDNKCTKVEILGNFSESSTKLYLRYLKKPLPIILTNLIDYGVSIEGETEETLCELPEILHLDILQRAVELAKLSYSGDLLLMASTLLMISAERLGRSYSRPQNSN